MKPGIKIHYILLITCCILCLSFSYQCIGEVDIKDSPVSLRECIKTALLNNRALQIERINPKIAQSTLASSFGYYDPLITSQLDQENATDTGGFDPIDFSRDAVYSARSEVMRSGITGYLPSGLNYSLTADYAYSYGNRNLLNFESYKVTGGATVKQPLLKNLWIDSQRMLIRVNRKNLKITELGVQYLTMDVINQVQQAYYELVCAHANYEIQLRLIEIKTGLLNGIRDQLSAGTSTVIEEKQAASQVARVQADLITASHEMHLAENVLKTLMGYNSTNWVQQRLLPKDRLVAIPEQLDLLESWKTGILLRPDYAQLKQDLEKADINLKYRRNQLFPSLDLIAGYGRRGASAMQTIPPLSARASASEAFNQFADSAAPSDMIGIIFSMPLTRKTERENFRTSQNLRKQADLRIREKEELIFREISDALNAVQSGWQRVAATQRASEAAREALEAEEAKLKAGKSNVYFVLQLQTDLSAAETSAVRAKTDYCKSLSQLHFNQGTLLQNTCFEIDLGNNAQ